MNPRNPEGKAKHRVCRDCTAIRMSVHHICPTTRAVSDWAEDEHGNRSRTITGGVCARTIENYGRPVAA